jgi:hypothetical protein
MVIYTIESLAKNIDLEAVIKTVYGRGTQWSLQRGVDGVPGK